MNKTPFVSVIVNCFNGERYLKEALNSILNQTYKDWEVIFWDNQSSDNSAKIFNSYKDKRFKYFYAPIHTLLYKARNEAIKKATGEIIAFLDVDDWWSEDKLEKQIPLFDDSKIGLVYSNLYLFYENTKKKEIYKNKILKKGYITLELLKDYNIGILSVLIRKTAYNSVVGFNNQYEFSGDFDFIIRLSVKWRIDCIQEPLAYYRIHSNNFTFINNVNNAIEIKELEKWILDEKIVSDRNLKPHLHNISKRNNFLKTMKHINEGKLTKAIKNIIFSPMEFSKIKLVLYIILPNIIVKKFKRWRKIQ